MNLRSVNREKCHPTTESLEEEMNRFSSIAAVIVEKCLEATLRCRSTFDRTQVKDLLNVMYVDHDLQPKEILKYISKDTQQSFRMSR